MSVCGVCEFVGGVVLGGLRQGEMFPGEVGRGEARRDSAGVDHGREVTLHHEACFSGYLGGVRWAGAVARHRAVAAVEGLVMKSYHASRGLHMK